MKQKSPHVLKYDSRVYLNNWGFVIELDSCCRGGLTKVYTGMTYVFERRLKFEYKL